MVATVSQKQITSVYNRMHGASSVDPKEFQYMFQLVCYDLEGKVPRDQIKSRIGTELRVETDEGKLENMTIPDNPAVRMMEMVSHEIKNSDLRVSMIIRINMLMEMLSSGKVAEWVKESPDEGQTMMHNCLFEAAATSKLDMDKFCFVDDDFRNLAHQAKARMDAEEAGEKATVQ